MITYRGLREKMNEQKIQKQDLHKIGISWGTISKIEKNEYIRLDILEKIARYLKCNIGDIVELKDD